MGDIRGLSIAGAFLKQYKQITNTCTKKSTGLRKQLKRRKLDMNNATADDVYNECGVLCIMKCTLFFMLILLRFGSGL